MLTVDAHILTADQAGRSGAGSKCDTFGIGRARGAHPRYDSERLWQQHQSPRERDLDPLIGRQRGRVGPQRRRARDWKRRPGARTTFEGTEAIQTLLVGRDITGVGAFQLNARP